MIDISDKHKCCGCSTCAGICPKHCITMEVDAEGFLYPKIDADICIDCHLCEKRCPVLNVKRETNDVRPTLYAAYAKDEEIRKFSSSGGIFTLLAEEIIERGGAVFGATFDESLNVYHLCIDNKKQLYRLRGSKYVQSNIGSTYIQAKKLLEMGQIVLYTGSPCQIEGLKQYLNGKWEENLILMDFVCHGVPSPLVWQSYKHFKEKEYKAKVANASFRGKKFGWRLFNMALDYQNGKKYECSINLDPYLQTFIRNVSLRPSCYECPFKKVNRESDITLADYWGIWKQDPMMYDDKGTSMVLVHSPKGIELLKSVKDRMVCKEENFDFVMKVNHNMTHSCSKPSTRSQFFSDILHLPFNDVYARNVRRSFIYEIKNDIKWLLKYVMYLEKRWKR